MVTNKEFKQSYKKGNIANALVANGDYQERVNEIMKDQFQGLALDDLSIDLSPLHNINIRLTYSTCYSF